MKRKTLALVSVLLVALLLSMAPGGALADDKAPAIVELVPDTRTIPIGATTDVQVWVRSVTHFYGVQFALRYDPAILDGVAVIPGPAFAGLPNNEWMLTQNDFVGNRARFAASLVGRAPLNGDLHLATIRFRGRGVGVSRLQWDNLILANDVGGPIPFIPRAGQIEVADRLNITGFAHLQGRTDHTGIDVEASGPVVATTVTAVDGRYTVPGVRAGRYQMLFEFDTYLVTQLRNCDTGAGPEYRPPTVTLVAGDLIRDQSIDILDLTRCAGAFGTADPGADVNGDGAVNIYDLVLIGINFGQAGPVIIGCP